MFGRRAKAGVIIAAFVVLAAEGVLLYRYYDHYYWTDGSSKAGIASGSASAFEETMTEGTAPKQSSPQRPAATANVPAANSAAFVHRATDANSRGDYTYLDHPRVNGDPGAVVLAVAAPDRGSAKDGHYKHNIGVWYEPQKRRWAIFNQDRAAVPAGSTFKVVVPHESEGFVHESTESSISGDSTYLDDPLVNGKPDAEVSVTQNWNPGGGYGVYNDHPVGVRYDADRESWAVYNSDLAPMKQGIAFNVTVS